MTDQTTANNSAVTENSKFEVKFEMLAKWLPRLAVFSIVVLLGVYFGNFKVFMGNDVFGDNNAFGTFGDFIGGALNPILGFLTVVLLIASIRFQIDELKLTRQEMQASTNVGRETKELHATNLKNEKDMFIVKSILENFVLLSDQVISIQNKTITSIEPAFIKELNEKKNKVRFIQLINFNFGDLFVCRGFFENEKYTNALSGVYEDLSFCANTFYKNILILKNTDYPKEIYLAKCDVLFDQLNSASLFYSEIIVSQATLLEPINSAKDLQGMLDLIWPHISPSPH
jgi:hypothetical protein